MRSDLDHGQLVYLYEQGATLSDLSIRFHASRDTLAKILRAQGADIRSRGGKVVKGKKQREAVVLDVKPAPGWDLKKCHPGMYCWSDCLDDDGPCKR